MDIKMQYSTDTTLTPQKVCQLIENGKINDLPLISPSFSSTGTSNTIFAFAGNPLASTVLDSTHVLLCYWYATGYLVKAVVLTINGTTVTAGTPVTITTNGSNNMMSCVALDSTHAIVCCEGTSYYLYATLLTISGDTISVGTSQAVNNVALGSSGASIPSAVIDTNKVLVCYYTTVLNAVILTISGDTISVGTSISTGIVASMLKSSMTILDSTHAFVIGADQSSSFYGAVLTINGTTITAGSVKTIFNGEGTPSYVECCSMDAKRVLIIHYSASSSAYGCRLLKIVNGDEFIIGNRKFLDSKMNKLPRCFKLDNTHAYVFGGYINSTSFQMQLLTITDGIDFVEPIYQYTATSALSTVCFSLIDSKHLISIHSTTAAVYAYVSTLNYYNGKPLGITQDSSGNVILKGMSKGHSGLTAGKKCYYDESGTITQNINNDAGLKYIGLAISSTEIHIPDYIIE